MKKTLFIKLLAGILALSLLAGCSPKWKDMEAIPVPKEDTVPVKKVIDKQYGVFYQIYPRSFRDSNGDGIGDIRGIIEALDYLNDGNPSTNTDLGVNGIWITPLTPAPTDHKYNTTDYYSIAPEYGKLSDYEELLSEAHKRGIKVIMDFVVNHVSASHQWYQEALKDPKSPYRDYFRWIKADTKGYNINAKPWGRKVWVKKGDHYNYELFEDIVPDLNFENPKVREEVKEIAKFWVDKGVDGFRLDTANNIYGPEEYPKGTDRKKNNIAWWTEFSKYVREIRPDFFLIGEIWDKPEAIAPYLKPFDGCWNFSLQENLPNMLNNGVDTAKFTEKLEKQYVTYDSTTKDYIDLPFLTNHDQDRFIGRLRNDPAKAKLAANIYLTLPGSPFIYAGEEIGMTTGNMRTPIKWFEEYKAPQTKWDVIKNSNQIISWEKQKDDTNSLYNYYKNIIRIRQGNEALMKGNFEGVNTGSTRVIGYKRNVMENGNVKKSVIVLHNLDFQEQAVKIEGVDFSEMKFYFESTGSGKNKIQGSEIKIAPQTTVILEK